MGHRPLEGEGVDAAEHHAAINVHHAIGVGPILLLGPECANPRAGTEVPGQPDHAEERILAVTARDVVVHGGEQPDLRPRHLAGELRGHDRLHDPPGVDQPRRHVKLLVAVEEERPPLGEEERLTRVEGELAHITLDLREVGVGRAVEREVGGEAEADVATDLGLSTAVLPAIAARATIHPRRQRRHHVEHQSGLQVGEPLEATRLRQER